MNEDVSEHDRAVVSGTVSANVLSVYEGDMETIERSVITSESMEGSYDPAIIFFFRELILMVISKK